jgi:hypothetical protein
VPTRDGDGYAPEDGDGLVAQIIPLRQRARDPDEQLQPATPAQPHAAIDAAGCEERSVWDQPMTELRRRVDAPGSEPPAASVASRGISIARLPRGLVVVAALLGMTVIALLVSNAIPGHVSGMRQLHASASSTSQARAPFPGGSAALRARHVTRAASSRDQQRPYQPARHLHARRGQAPGVQDGTSDSTVADSGGSAPANSPLGRTETASVGVTSTPAPSESPPAQTQTALQASANTSSTPQQQCVPGELGC